MGRRRRVFVETSRRTLTDEEYDAAFAAYEAALAEYNRTGGVVVEPGPVVIRVTYRTAGGSSATYMAEETTKPGEMLLTESSASFGRR